VMLYVHCVCCLDF